MKLFRFGKDVGRTMERYQSSSIIYSLIAQISSPSNIGCMHIEPEGIVGLHEAPTPQLFLVVEGEGWVRGENEPSLLVKMGEGVFFDCGEWHESGSLKGMTCIIVQCDEFDKNKLTSL